jgi:hypothetical protein
MGDNLVRSGRVKALDERVLLGRLVGEVEPSMVRIVVHSERLSRRVLVGDQIRGDLDMRRAKIVSTVGQGME